MVPWPWPLAPVFILVLLGVAALVLYGVYHYVIRGEEPEARMAGENALVGATQQGAQPRRLPILAGFGKEILPVLVLLWAGLIIAYVITERDYLWTILPWATVTTIMLWPVGRHLKRSYLSYRSVGFVIGVVSMAYIPFAGFGLMSGLSFGVKSAIFFGLVVDLTALGILPGLRWFIGKPLGMFFRRTGLHSREWWRRFIYSGIQRYLSAQECLKLGLVDEVCQFLDECYLPTTPSKTDDRDG